jgi:branched-chain amino acid transport system substrate-binding protein
MLVTQYGGEVAGEAYVPVNSRRRDFLPVMRDIREVNPDFIFSTVVGEATTYLYQAYADAGFNPNNMPIASLTTTEAEILAMGPDVGENHYTAGSYFQGTGGAREASFVKSYEQRFGEPGSINMCAEAAYFQVHLLAKALALTNSLETDVLLPVVLGSFVDAPQGRVSVNPTSNHANLWSRVGRANRKGQFDIVRQSSSQVDADPFLICALHGGTGAEAA